MGRRTGGAVRSSLCPNEEAGVDGGLEIGEGGGAAEVRVEEAAAEDRGRGEGGQGDAGQREAEGRDQAVAY